MNYTILITLRYQTHYSGDTRLITLGYETRRDTRRITQDTRLILPWILDSLFGDTRLITRGYETLGDTRRIITQDTRRIAQRY